MDTSSRINIDLCLKCIMIIAFITVLSLALIFVYDFICQSKLFNIKKIKISGTNQTDKEEILELADISCNKNIFQINLSTAKKLIASHPWVKSVTIKRDLNCELLMSVIEQKPIAIVQIGNLANVLINANGRPFKEYNPQKDNLKNLPVITGVDLSLKAIQNIKGSHNIKNTHNIKGTHKKTGSQYMFEGPLFNSIMEFLKTDNPNIVRVIKADTNTGISIEANDIYNKSSLEPEKTILINLGFHNYKAKLNKAIKISEYIDKYFPGREICAIDLFNLEKIFIKTIPGRLLQSG